MIARALRRSVDCFLLDSLQVPRSWPTAQTMLTCISLVLMTGLIVTRPANAQVSWRRISQSVDLVVDLVAVGYDSIDQTTVVYATDRDTGKVYAYQNAPFSWREVGDNWQSVPNYPPFQPLRMLAVGGQHGELFGLYGIQVFRYTGKEKSWEWLDGPYDAIYGGHGVLFAIETDTRDVWDYDKQRGVTSNLPWGWYGQAPAQQLAIGGPSRVYRLPPDGTGVWHYDRTKTDWIKIGGPAKAIYAGGSELFAVNPISGDILRYHESAKAWTRIGGPAKMFAVDYKGRLYALSPDGQGVFMYTGKLSEWKKIGGAAGSIYTGGFAARLYATNPQSHDLWELRLE
jgi:hypothetical protein